MPTCVTALAKVMVGVFTTVVPPAPAVADPILMTVVDPEAPPPVALPAEPDAGTIVTELAFACMKYGYFRHGLISEDIIRQSSLAVIGYLEQVLPPELAQSRPS